MESNVAFYPLDLISCTISFFFTYSLSEFGEAIEAIKHSNDDTKSSTCS